ncbi:unnamed protein product, partial [marine sediment metagenome]
GFSLRRNPERGTAAFGKHPTADWTEDQWRQYIYGYDRLLEMVDAHIKLVIDELENQGLLENTMIIYTSDHGDGHASHKWNQKMTFYEEAINVPFIVSWKGKTRAGYVDEATLSSTGLDIFPTILSAAGVPIPESLLGLDLTPQVLADSGGETLPERTYVVSEINQQKLKGRMVVTADYKYILFDGGANPEQLFDLANDPGELWPVTYQPEYREQLIAHRNMLLEWNDRIDDADFSPVGKFPDLAAYPMPEDLTEGHSVNKGMLTNKYEIYQPLADAMVRINTRTYDLIEFFDKTNLSTISDTDREALDK